MIYAPRVVPLPVPRVEAPCAEATCAEYAEFNFSFQLEPPLPNGGARLHFHLCRLHAGYWCWDLGINFPPKGGEPCAP